MKNSNKMFCNLKNLNISNTTVGPDFDALLNMKFKCLQSVDFSEVDLPTARFADFVQKNKTVVKLMLRCSP